MTTDQQSKLRVIVLAREIESDRTQAKAVREKYAPEMRGLLTPDQATKLKDLWKEWSAAWEAPKS